MRLRVLPLGLAGLLMYGVLFGSLSFVQAQDQATLAATANNAMQRMADALAAALSAPNESLAKANVRTAIGAGEEAVAALRTLRAIATDDVVRSRSEAALTQTENALSKARAALERSGDAFRGAVEAARAEVVEAIVEFAPVLNLVGPVRAPAPQLPRAGGAGLTQSALAVLGITGLGLLAAGALLRRRYLVRA